MKVEEGKIKDDESYILDSVGLRLLLKEISLSKKLIVGHNCLLDLMYLINQCFKDLPEDYNEFKKIVHQIFPNIIDTKFIANSEKFKETFNSSVLKNVYERILMAPFKPVKYEWENPYLTYDLEDQNMKEHEAGFDAFLTGYIFLVILDYLKVPLDDKFEKSKQLSPFLNRIALQRIMTPYIYISGQEPLLSRSHVFYIKFPSTWQSSDIQDIFKNYGAVNVAWVDSTSAFVSLYNKENSSCVIKTIKKAAGFEIKSFADYQVETKSESLKRKKENNSEETSTCDSSPQLKRKKTFKESNSW
jgi:poly(A)-specific ribonuclease